MIVSGKNGRANGSIKCFYDLFNAHKAKNHGRNRGFHFFETKLIVTNYCFAIARYMLNKKEVPLITTRPLTSSLVVAPLLSTGVL